MSNTFTLEALREEIEKKYAPLVFKDGDKEFVLQSLMMVPKEVRAAVQERLETLTESKDENETVSEDDTLEALKFVLSSVTKDKKGPALLRVLGNELIYYSALMEKWSEATQPGEASSSPS